ncbi:MAG: hypothetical protein EOP52_12750 [Sphingobacteriales bacterium]|nr:MAG: hypothetical protein EOP52_12750 [Sphingobacteriales bacterium]
MSSIPALQIVARAKRRQIATLLGILLTSVISAFVLVGLFEAPAWVIGISIMSGIILAIVVCLRMFIRWRLRAYDEASNIRQLHLIAQLFDMTASRQLDAVLAVLSNRTESQRWKALLDHATNAPFSLFPEGPVPERAIRYSAKRYWVLLLLSGFGLIPSWGAARSQSSKTDFVYLLIAGGLFLWSLRAIYRSIQVQPALILQAKGILFPRKNQLLFWNDLSAERVEKIIAGKLRTHQLKYRHQGTEEVYTVDNWDITPGELRYLLLWYRHAYEMDIKNHRHAQGDDRFLFTTS